MGVAVPGIDQGVGSSTRGWSLRRTSRHLLDRVLVTGLGPVGALAAQIFAASGYTVTAIDPLPARRALASALGLSEVRADFTAEAGQKHAPLDGMQLAVECSGHERALIDCCQIVAKRGEVVMVGVPWKQRCDASAFALVQAVFHRYVVLRSGWEWEVPRHAQDFTIGTIAANLTGALRYLEQGRVRVAGLARSVAIADCQQVWQELLHGRSATPTVVFTWP